MHDNCAKTNDAILDHLIQTAQHLRIQATAWRLALARSMLALLNREAAGNCVDFGLRSPFLV